MIETLRQPEYTGENRCLPCTVLNVLIAFVVGSLAAAVPLVTDAVPASVSLLAGSGIVALSLALIYLRGYLIPGTPELTKRYLPTSVLQWFGKEPVVPAEVEHADADLDAERVLTDVGALEPCPDSDDLCLSEEFRTAWNEEIEALPDGGVDAETVVQTLGLGAEDITVREHGDARVIRDEANFVGKWPSEAALVADTAAATVLESRLDYWGELTPPQKGQLLNGLRLFLEDCPTAEGGVEFGSETVESCCSTREVVAVTCEESGERLFEQPLNG